MTSVLLCARSSRVILTLCHAPDDDVMDTDVSGSHDSGVVCRAPDTPPGPLYSATPEPIAPLVEFLSSLTPSLVTWGSDPVRQVIIPQCVREEISIPECLLRYIDVSLIDPELSIPDDIEQEAEVLSQRLRNATQEELQAALQTVNLGVEPAVIEKDTVINGDVIVRARGLPWQASDGHVAQFFAGLEIAPGGIALCLSTEGRRNGEALVRFTTPEMREMALKRHRHFLLSRYIEVYKATSDEFLHIAAGSSTEAVSFVSSGGAMIIRMRGLPYDCSEQQIREFFIREPESCEVMDQVLFVARSDGRPTGDAFVQFADEAMGQRALTKHRQTIGNRYIELFRSTCAEVQQVVKRSNEPAPQSAARRDCIRLRGLPYEARVEQVVEFLGDHARNVRFQGVHMVFNSQGHPSGECFIQMQNEPAASAAAQAAHNKFMTIGKKQRYIEVFQCCADDMHLMQATPPVAPPPVMLPPRPFMPPNNSLPGMLQMNAPMYWPYPSPPVSPNMMLPGQVQQLVVCNIAPTTGVNDLVQQFSQNPEFVVDSVVFTRVPTPSLLGEAVVTLRPRGPVDAPMIVDPQQYLTKIPMDGQFIPGLQMPISMHGAMPHQPMYTMIQS